ncbi:MAG: prepilin-type N-terminal cleavage/methylation domain-containing protein [Opitutaceae bacterium]|nr:prepilin-type N-terminal cleavage/methylation domain-containing protein [Opitutaceae bacterium]
MRLSLTTVRRSRTACAFTLVELMVALAITAVLAGMLIGITTQVMGAWNRSRGALTISNQVKIALDQIASDLESLCLRDDGGVWLAATVQGDQTTAAGESGATSLAQWTATSGGQTKPGAVATPGSLELQPAGALVAAELQDLHDFRFGMAGVWLRFFTVEPDRNEGGGANLSAPRAVAYQILRYRVGGATSPIQYGLFRSWTSPDRALSAGFSLFDTLSTPSAVAGYNVGDASTAGLPGNIRRPRQDSVIANNVVDFGVRIWCRNSSGELVVRFPSFATNYGFAARQADVVVGAPNTVPPVVAGSPPAFAEMTYGFPEEIEVFLRVLTDDGAAQVEAFEKGLVPGTTWWDIVLQHSEVHTRRVLVRSRAL